MFMCMHKAVSIVCTKTALAVDFTSLLFQDQNTKTITIRRIVLNENSVKLISCKRSLPILVIQKSSHCGSRLSFVMW